MDNSTTKNLTSLLNELKKQGVSNAAACKALGKPTSTVNTWKKAGYGAKQHHIDTLIAAFPYQLTDKAIELGISLPDPVKNPESVLPIVEELLKTVGKLKEELESVNMLKEEKMELLKEIGVLKTRLNEKAP